VEIGKRKSGKHLTECIVHSESSLGWGGQEHRTLTELVGFKRRGVSVGLVASPKSVLHQRAKAAGISTLDCSFSKFSMLADVISLSLWLRGREIRVLNTHSSRDGWVLGLAGRLAGIPLIVRTRHIDVDYPSPRLSKVAFRGLADHVLTTSEKITQHLRRMFEFENDRISTLPTGIDLGLFTPHGPRAEEIQKDPRVPLIGMVSVLRSWKGHSVFLKAVAALKAEGFRARYVIVGGGQSPVWIEEQIEVLGIGDVVHLAGHREDVPEVLRALDLLVIPSTKHEGIPQIGLQALACKTAVIGSDVGGIPEIIRHGETGRIFSSENPEALAGAIRAAFFESGLTQQMKEAGRRLVEERHSTESMLDELEMIYGRYLPDWGKQRLGAGVS
jgi:glycosyltransferase involved in cell wall biosynthesis